MIDQAPPPTKLQWVSHPVREEPGGNWIVLLFVALIAAAMWLTTGRFYWVGFGVLIVLAANRQWFLPTFLTLDEEGAEVRGLLLRRRKSWREIKRAQADRHGVLLSPFAFPSRLEVFRGLFLRFSRNREAVMEFVNRHVVKEEK